MTSLRTVMDQENMLASVRRGKSTPVKLGMLSWDVSARSWRGRFKPKGYGETGWASRNLASEWYLPAVSPPEETLRSRDRTDKQLYAQSALPLTLIPIRIDLEIPPFTPAAALPLPADAQAFGINPSLPAYRAQDLTPSYRLRDCFMWNLHESLFTPEQFSQMMVHELDLPNSSSFALQIAHQIRLQLEEYSGIALHPLFRTSGPRQAESVARATAGDGTNESPPRKGPASATTLPSTEPITATATLIPMGSAESHNPDDAYRCIVDLSVNLLNKLFNDKFEWSLLHPPGAAESFARQTCADMGLSGEWAATMGHAIYEAVLRLKKEACESGSLVQGYNGELDNLAPEGQEAGWRCDNEHLADEWEPKLEILSKEEIEKREGDRERQIRRQRRETARFTSSALLGMPASTPSLMDQAESAETPMGRGERSKKKRRFRSLSPSGRVTPAGISDTAGSADNNSSTPTDG